MERSRPNSNLTEGRKPKPSFQGGQGGSLGQGGSVGQEGSPSSPPPHLPPFKEGRGGSRYKNADPMEYGLLKAYARENRKNMTQSESILWSQIRGKALGATFLRQYIIGDYITDFACLEKMLVIELDGGYHSLPEQLISDEQRTADLHEMGYRVIRFANEELFQGIDLVLTKIRNALNNAPL